MFLIGSNFLSPNILFRYIFYFSFLFNFFNLLQKYKDIFFQGQEDKNSLSSISNIFTHSLSLSNSETIETPLFLSLSRVCASFALNLYRRSSESNLRAKLYIFSVERSVKRRRFCPKPLRIG